MTIIKPAIVLATLLAAGSAMAGEGNPNPMVPSTDLVIQGDQLVHADRVREDSRAATARGAQNATQDTLATIDTSSTGAYSNN